MRQVTDVRFTRIEHQQHRTASSSLDHARSDCDPAINSTMDNGFLLSDSFEVLRGGSWGRSLTLVCRCRNQCESLVSKD